MTSGKVYGWSKSKKFRFKKNIFCGHSLHDQLKFNLEISLPVCIFFFPDLGGRLDKHIISRGVNLEFMYLTERLGSTNNIFMHQSFVRFYFKIDIYTIKSFHVFLTFAVSKLCNKKMWQRFLTHSFAVWRNLNDRFKFCIFLS